MASGYEEPITLVDWASITAVLTPIDHMPISSAEAVVVQNFDEIQMGDEIKRLLHHVATTHAIVDLRDVTPPSGFNRAQSAFANLAWEEGAAVRFRWINAAQGRQLADRPPPLLHPFERVCVVIGIVYCP